jgi:hypothetical protein
MVKLTLLLAAALVAGLIAVPLCDAAFGRSRQVPQEFQQEHPCPSTGSTSGACPGYVRDHIEPLCGGGADATWNMQWQTAADSYAKDKIERQGCRR